MGATGLERSVAETSLRELLESRRGHLSVGDQGDLLYEFDPSFIRRNVVSSWRRFKQTARNLLVRGFKLWIVVMLVVYFAIFVALAVAAIIAMRSPSDWFPVLIGTFSPRPSVLNWSTQV